MPDALDKIAGAEITLRLRDNSEWRFRRLTLAEWAELKQEAIANLPNPLITLAKVWDSLPDATVRNKMLETALKLAGREPEPEVEVVDYLCTVRGMFSALKKVLVSPKFETLDEFLCAMRNLTKPEHEAIGVKIAEACGQSTIEQLARIFPAETGQNPPVPARAQ